MFGFEAPFILLSRGLAAIDAASLILHDPSHSLESENNGVNPRLSRALPTLDLAHRCQFQTQPPLAPTNDFTFQHNSKKSLFPVH